MPKYAVRRQCHFDCAGAGDNFGSEPAFVNTLDHTEIIKAIRKTDCCCVKKDEHGHEDLGRVFPAKTIIFVFELENGDPAGTEYLVEEFKVPTYRVISGRIYDPEMAEDFAARVGADCVKCFNREKEDCMDVTPTGMIDSYIDGDLYVQVKCNNCGSIGEPGDGEYWQYHDDLELEFPNQNPIDEVKEVKWVVRTPEFTTYEFITKENLYNPEGDYEVDLFRLTLNASGVKDICTANDEDYDVGDDMTEDFDLEAIIAICEASDVEDVTKDYLEHYGVRRARGEDV
jgi:hypothetical protein